MLKHNLPEEQADQIRVTPEELAAAISRIEARQNNERQQSEGTVAIGEVVKELGLEATPEEILAEVQTGRTKQAVEQKTRFSSKQRSGLILVTAGLAVILAALQTGLQLGGNSNSPLTANSTAASGAGISGRSSQIIIDPNLLVSDVSGKLVMLSEVGDNEPVRCLYDAGTFQPFQPGNSTPAWQLIKHEGKIYVTGRIVKMSPKVLQANGADISAIADPNFTVPLTLALGNFEVLPNAGSNIEFHAVNIHLDKYAYEKWQP